MTDDPPIGPAIQAILGSPRCSVTLPAGCGKTELIAAAAGEAAARGDSSLVLTHTHAGVDALMSRMRKYGIGREQVSVRTIDSWSYDLVAHFPELSGLQAPPIPNWGDSSLYHTAAARAVRTKAVRRMLEVSYGHVFVDEYQDCLVSQHQLAAALADSRPTTVLGDPLQCLFHFGSNLPVSWATDVLPNFPEVQVEYRPRRWEPGRPDLGRWLLDIRSSLINGQAIDLSAAPIKWVPRVGHQTVTATCNHAFSSNGSVAVLGSFRADCVKAASLLGGRYPVMEAMDDKTVLTLARTVDSKGGERVAAALVEFAVSSAAGIAKWIPAQKRQQLVQGKTFSTRDPHLERAYAAVRELWETPDPARALAALDALARLPNVTIHCKVAWRELARALEGAARGREQVADCLGSARSQARATGRRPVSRVMTRPLLAKGLEYDHVVVMDPTRYSAQDLYVALTRGSKSVTVVSATSLLPPAVMAVGKTG